MGEGQVAYGKDGRVRDLLGPLATPFIKGFVVIQSQFELDVVVVYTAAGADGAVETLHTERVPPRRITQ